MGDYGALPLVIFFFKKNMDASALMQIVMIGLYAKRVAMSVQLGVWCVFKSVAFGMLIQKN